MVLVKWTYTKEEWINFLRALKRRKKFFGTLWFLIQRRPGKRIPSISIAGDKVWIGEEQQYFRSGRHSLRNIDLRNEGDINVLSISYEKEGTGHVIKIPVPRGKLREAIEVQDKLMPAY